MSITDSMRKAFDDCTVMAGVENDFECVYITKAAATFYLDEIDAAFRELAQTTAKLEEYDNYIQWLCQFVPEDRWDEVYDEITKMGIDYVGADDV